MAKKSAGSDCAEELTLTVRKCNRDPIGGFRSAEIKIQIDDRRISLRPDRDQPPVRMLGRLPVADPIQTGDLDACERRWDTCQPDMDVFDAVGGLRVRAHDVFAGLS